MKRFFSFLLLPFLCLNGCKAQKNKVPDNKSLLWRISGHGLAKPSYLFGTIHLLCPDDYLWTAAMKKSLSACKEVCFEMDMDDPSAMQSAAEGMMSTGAKQLKDYFSPDDYARLSSFAKDSLGFDLSMMQQMKPVMLQTLFTTKAISCMIPVSYEANIMEEAKRQQITVTGLEAAEEQLQVLHSMQDDSVARSLVQMADSFSESRAAFQKMLAAYKAQDLPELYNQIKSSKELGDDLNLFLDDRNEKWIPRMQEKMKQKAVFFAVGAGHLWGDLGVINLLRKAGYTVEPLK